MKGRLTHMAVWVGFLAQVLGFALGWHFKPYTHYSTITDHVTYTDTIYEPYYPMLSEEAFYKEVAKYCGYKTVIAGSYIKADCQDGGVGLLISQGVGSVFIVNNFIECASGGIKIIEEQDLDQARAEDDPLWLDIEDDTAGT